MMKKITIAQDDNLLDYLDGKLDNASVQQLREQLENSGPLRERLEELRLVHRTLALQHHLESPSDGFVQRVMAKLHSNPIHEGLSPRNGLLLFAGITVAMVMLVWMIQGGLFDQAHGIITIPAGTSTQKYLPAMPTIAVNGKLIIKALIGLTLAIAFLVLDQTVLRPFFQKRSGAEL